MIGWRNENSRMKILVEKNEENRL